MNIVASIENQETIKRSVENGMGISIISKLAAKRDRKRKTVGISTDRRG